MSGVDTIKRVQLKLALYGSLYGYLATIRTYSHIDFDFTIGEVQREILELQNQAHHVAYNASIQMAENGKCE